MNEHATLNAIDYAVFFAYMALTSVAWLCRLAQCAAQPAGLFSRREEAALVRRRHVDGGQRHQQRDVHRQRRHRLRVRHGRGDDGLERLDHLQHLSVHLPAVLRADRPVHDAAVSRAAVQLDLPVSVRDFAGDRLHLHAAGRVAVRGRAGDRADLRACRFPAIWRPTSSGESSFSP